MGWAGRRQALRRRSPTPAIARRGASRCWGWRAARRPPPYCRRATLVDGNVGEGEGEEEGEEHLEVLKWLRAEGCPWDILACAWAAGAVHLEVLKWLRAGGCP